MLIRIYIKQMPIRPIIIIIIIIIQSSKLPGTI